MHSSSILMHHLPCSGIYMSHVNYLKNSSKRTFYGERNYKFGKHEPQCNPLSNFLGKRQPWVTKKQRNKCLPPVTHSFLQFVLYIKIKKNPHLPSISYRWKHKYSLFNIQQDVQLIILQASEGF